MLTVAKFRGVLSTRHNNLTEEIEKRTTQVGKTVDELVAEDPFLAGRMYQQGMIEMDLLIASQT
jgi:siroheme synthase